MQACFDGRHNDMIGRFPRPAMSRAASSRPVDISQSRKCSSSSQSHVHSPTVMHQVLHTPQIPTITRTASHRLMPEPLSSTPVAPASQAPQTLPNPPHTSPASASVDPTLELRPGHELIQRARRPQRLPHGQERVIVTTHVAQRRRACRHSPKVYARSTSFHIRSLKHGTATLAVTRPSNHPSRHPQPTRNGAASDPQNPSPKSSMTSTGAARSAPESVSRWSPTSPNMGCAPGAGKAPWGNGAKGAQAAGSEGPGAGRSTAGKAVGRGAGAAGTERVPGRDATSGREATGPAGSGAGPRGREAGGAAGEVAWR